jgi:hypothetical protein
MVAAKRPSASPGATSSRPRSERTSPKRRTWRRNCRARVVLAVHVVGDGAAEGGELGAGRDRQEPAAGNRQPQHFVERHAGFGADHAGLPVGADEAVEGRRWST